MKKINFIALLLLGILTLTSVGVINTFAADTNDRFGFDFKIGALQVDTYAGVSAYRSSYDVHNAWKVEFEASGEGTGTYTNFCMTDANDNDVTVRVCAKAGTTPYYNPTLSSAGGKSVWLTGENNNWNMDSYWVSGRWDQQTGVYK